MGHGSPGKIGKPLKDGAGKNYGMFSFTEKHVMKPFMSWMKKKYPDLAATMDAEVCSSKFDQQWKAAGEKNKDAMIAAQVDYVFKRDWMKGIVPNFKKHTGINLNDGRLSEGAVGLAMEAYNWAPAIFTSSGGKWGIADSLKKYGNKLDSKKFIKVLYKKLHERAVVNSSYGGENGPLSKRWARSLKAANKLNTKSFSYSGKGVSSKDISVDSVGVTDTTSSSSSGSEQQTVQSQDYLGTITSVFSDALSKVFGNEGTTTTTTSSGTTTTDNTSNEDSTPISGEGVERLLNVAKNELDYQEKSSNSKLDKKHANVGSANYTKYGAFTGANGAAWCASFVSWVFNQAFGKDAKKVIRGPYSAAVDGLWGNMKKADAMKKKPQPGDIIIYKNGTSHTGIVESVNDKKKTFTSIEGNTSGGKEGFDRDGGIVARKTGRPWNYSKVTGFGRPDWSAVSSSSGIDTSTDPRYNKNKDKKKDKKGKKNKSGKGSGLLDIINSPNFIEYTSGSGTDSNELKQRISTKKMAEKIIKFTGNGNNEAAVKLIYNKIFTNEDPNGMKALTGNKTKSEKEYMKLYKKMVEYIGNMDAKLDNLEKTVNIESQLLALFKDFATKLLAMKTAELESGESSSELDPEFESLMNTLVNLAK